MRAIVLGNKDLAVLCLDVILKHGIHVVGIVLNPDDDGREEGKWYKSLKKVALQRGISAIQPKNVSSPAGLEFIQNLAPDFLFSFSYSRILKGYILNQARCGAFNIHFARLPHYRGCLPIVYALANGDSLVGVTLHVMDEGIDTGDIVAQTLLPVEEGDTAYTVYFKCVAAGASLLDQTLPDLMSGTYTRRPQNLAEGSYHKQVYPNDRWLSPVMSPSQMSSFVRAHTFVGYPPARANLDGVEHEVFYHDGYFSIPGKGLKNLTAEELHQIVVAGERIQAQSGR